MTLEKLHKALASIGIKVVYQESLERLSPPYIAYFDSSDSTFAADGVTVAVASDVEIHLVTKPRDLAMEEEIEKVLAGLSLTWDKSLHRDSKQCIFDAAYIVTIVAGKD